MKLETLSGVRRAAGRPSVDETLANRPEKTDKQTGGYGMVTALSCKYKEQNSEPMSMPGGYGSPPVTPVSDGGDRIPRASKQVG